MYKKLIPVKLTIGERLNASLYRKNPELIPFVLIEEDDFGPIKILQAAVENEVKITTTFQGRVDQL